MKTDQEAMARQLAAELDPLLDAVEVAIVAGDSNRTRELSMKMLALALKYSEVLERDVVRAVLNGPKANAIAARLGVAPMRLH